MSPGPGTYANPLSFRPSGKYPHSSYKLLKIFDFLHSIYLGSYLAFHSIKIDFYGEHIESLSSFIYVWDL